MSLNTPRYCLAVSGLFLTIIFSIHPSAAYAGHSADNGQMAACLRVLTYNIGGLSGPVPESIILDAIKDLDADLIGLQEVYAVRGLAKLFRDDSRSLLSKLLNQAGYHTYWSSYAGARAELKPLFDPLVVYEPGNLLAVRENLFEITESPSAMQLSNYPRALGLGRENRVLQHIGLRWLNQDKYIDFYNTHLTHRGRRSDAEDTPLMEEIHVLRRILSGPGRKDTSIVLTADINLTPKNRGYHLLMNGNGTGPALLDIWAEFYPAQPVRPPTLDPDNTFFSRHSLLEKLTGNTGRPPPLYLDYILVGPKKTVPFSVNAADVVLEQQYRGHNYSDHYGVMGKLCL